MTSDVPRRAIFDGPQQPIRIDRHPMVDDLGVGEVLVRIDLATVCGSDLHTSSGRRSGHTPSVLGHEAVGTIVEVGPGRDARSVGRRVTWPLVDSCGDCPACTRWGLPQKCATLFKYGHAPLDDGHGLNGCFATHIVLRAGTPLVAVPDRLPDAVVAPANCALATMVAIVRQVPGSTRSLLIQGAGLLGIYGAALLRARGVEQVYITDPDVDRASLAERFGATPVDQSELGDDSVDSVIEVAGVSDVVAEALRALRPGGRYVIAGMVHPDTALDLRGVDLVSGALTIVGVHNYVPVDLTSAVAFLDHQRDTHPWSTLVSPPHPLDRVDRALADAVGHRWHRIAIAPNGPNPDDPGPGR